MIKAMDLWNELQAYWKMDDASGQVADSPGNGNHWNNYSVLYEAQGKTNKSMDFSGGVNYVRVPHTSSVNISLNISLSSLIYWKGGSGDYNILTKEGAYEFRVNSNYVNFAINPWVWRGGNTSHISSNAWQVL